MADLNAAAAASEASDLTKHLSTQALMHNARVLEDIRGMVMMFAGSATGILGATGLQGLLTYLAFYIITSFAILTFKMKANVSSYFPMKWYSFLLSGAPNHLLSFMLFWTMFYTLVYIY